MPLPIVIHNSGETTYEAEGNSLRVTTPAARWAYALELPARPNAPSVEKGKKLKLSVRVYEGSIGIGFLLPNGKKILGERQIASNEDSECVEIPIPEDAPLCSLVLRNTSTRGSSTAKFEISGDEIFPFSEAIARAKARTHSLGSVQRVNSTSPGGFVTDAIDPNLSILIHNSDETTCKAEGDALRVTTPTAQWAYALEVLPRHNAPMVGKGKRLKLRVRIHEGSIGIGFLLPDGKKILGERQIASNEESKCVEIPIPEGAPLWSLVLRNTSTRGSSTADLEILGDEFFAFSETVARTAAQERLLGHPAFRGLQRQKHITAPGFVTNAIGQRTAVRFEQGWTQSPEWQEERFEEPDFPWSWPHEETYEWIALAEAVQDAHETFTMVELGAGYGRWLVAGARLARMSRPGMKLKLVGVEAAPAHYRWMHEHFEHNDLIPSEHDLFEAVVDAQSGTAYFCDSNDPGSDYGQHVDSGIPDPARLIPTAVAAIGINDLLRRYEQIDLIDMDIQGHERVVVPAGIEEMSKRVRRVYIGIHQPALIATELTELFTKSGWTNVASYPCLSEVETPFGTISFTDGCQYWVNPRLPPVRTLKDAIEKHK